MFMACFYLVMALVDCSAVAFQCIGTRTAERANNYSLDQLVPSYAV
jgi:hypothetical protein